MSTADPDKTDPSKLLPRDETGSYLHLKLKRFPSIDDLKIPYAIKTWKAIPHDAEVDTSPSNRSLCRQCHSKINKGDLRMRLWLQCHKGCKIGAFLHGEKCFCKYPETIKLEGVEELVGLDKLSEKQQAAVRESFRLLKDDENASRKKRKLNG